VTEIFRSLNLKYVTYVNTPLSGFLTLPIIYILIEMLDKIKKKEDNGTAIKAL